METKIVFAIVVSALEIGCTTPPSQAGSQNQPGVTAPVSCGMLTKSDTCKKHDCTVTITIDGNGNPQIAPFNLNVTQQDVHILWEVPPGWVFRSQRGDGAWFDDNDDGSQFSENYATDDPNGGTGGTTPPQNYHWLFKNSTSGIHNYHVTFRNLGTGNMKTCDPTINNSQAVTD